MTYSYSNWKIVNFQKKKKSRGERERGGREKKKIKTSPSFFYPLLNYNKN